MTKTGAFLSYIKKRPRILWSSLSISLLYGVLYYLSIGLIYFENHTFGLLGVENPSQVMFKLRAPFLWEPTHRIYTGLGVTIDLSPLNLLVMVVLVCLAFVNIGLLMVSIKAPKVCRIQSKTSRLAAMVPAFLSGFACCAPTFIILWVSLFGGVATSLLLVLRWALPVAMVLLTLGAIQGLRKLDPSAM